MTQPLTRRQFSKIIYGRECRLDIWAHIARLGQQEPPSTQFTVQEILTGLNYGYPKSVVREELEAMTRLAMLARVEGSSPLQYGTSSDNNLGRIAWEMQDGLEKHYQTTFGDDPTL